MIVRAISGFVVLWAIIGCILHFVVRSSLKQKWKAIKFLTVSGLTATVALSLLFVFINVF